jgi:predicted acetyltransferase
MSRSQFLRLQPRESAEALTDDEAALRDTVCQALNIPHKAWPVIITNVGRENLRTLQQEGRVVAGCGLYQMGQWFGGKVVPSAGVSLVGVAPDCRGTGIARDLMAFALRDARERGQPIAALFASSQRVYRSAGFEQAGHRVLYELDLQHIGNCPKPLEMHPVSLADNSPFLEMYQWRCAHGAGLLERTPGLWNRVLRFAHDPDSQQYAYLIGDPDDPQGYVILRHEAVPIFTFKIIIRDYVVKTAAAGLTLWNFLAGHRSIAASVIWSGSSNDPLLCLPHESRYLRLVEWHRWMLRIVDLPRAFEARGYPPDAKAELHLDITDEIIPENAGCWVVSIEDSSAHVERGGHGTLRMDIKGLAPLYTGMMSPAELQRVGWIEGEEFALMAAERPFLGPTPWIVEMF